MYFIVLFVGLAASADICTQIKTFTSCVRQKSCVFGVDFNNRGGCLEEETSEDFELSKVIHSSFRCVTTVGPLPRKSNAPMRPSKSGESTLPKLIISNATSAQIPVAEKGGLSLPSITTAKPIVKDEHRSPPKKAASPKLSPSKDKPAPPKSVYHQQDVKVDTSPIHQIPKVNTQQEVPGPNILIANASVVATTVPSVVVVIPTEGNKISSSPIQPAPVTVPSELSPLSTQQPSQIPTDDLDEEEVIRSLIVSHPKQHVKWNCVGKYQETDVQRTLRTWCRGSRMAHKYSHGKTPTKQFQMWQDFSPVQYNSTICQKLMWMRKNCTEK